MKVNFKKNLVIETTLNSSEAIMFNQGGRHDVDLNLEELDIFDFHNIKITVQLDRDDQCRFNFINSEAAKHRKEWHEINDKNARS